MKTLTAKTRAWLLNPSDLARIGTENPPTPYLTTSDMTGSGWIDLGEVEVSVPVPEIQGLINQAEGALRAAIQKVQADTYVKVTALEGMISNLLALEYSPPPAESAQQFTTASFDIDDDIPF